MFGGGVDGVHFNGRHTVGRGQGFELAALQLNERMSLDSAKSALGNTDRLQLLRVVRRLPAELSRVIAHLWRRAGIGQPLTQPAIRGWIGNFRLADVERPN